MTKRISKLPLEGQETSDMSPDSVARIGSRNARRKQPPKAPLNTSINEAERRAIDIAFACDRLSAGVPITRVLALLSCRRRWELPIAECHLYALSVLDVAEAAMRAAGATGNFTEKESPNATA